MRSSKPFFAAVAVQIRVAVLRDVTPFVKLIEE